MAIGVDFATLVDARAVGSEVVRSDFYTIPGPPTTGTVSYRTIELPLNVVTPPSLTNPIYVRAVDSVTHIPTGPIFTMVTSPTAPLPGQFQIDTVKTFTVGTLVFNLLDGATTVEIIYTGRGSLIFATDVNDPRDEIKDGRSTETTLGVRYDKIEDGTRIQSGKILPRHISTVNTDNYTFPNDVTVNGSLNVLGTMTTIHSNNLTIGDNIITLDADLVGAPSVDAGIEINRGTSPNTYLYWRETAGRWEFTGGGLSLPDGNLDMQHHQVVSFSPQNVADQTAETALVATSVDGQLIWRTDLKTLRTFNSSSSLYKSVGMSLNRFDVVAGTANGTYSGSLTVFALPFTYNVGSSQLFVYYQGVLMVLGAGNDYVETDSSTVTLNFSAVAGRAVTFVNLAIPV